jgi:beta-glucosidase-like glycosyl hydrolase
MGAYNRVNGESASASQRLLGDILRRDWGFTGYVVSTAARSTTSRAPQDRGDAGRRRRRSV